MATKTDNAAGYWDKDEEYGRRLDTAFAEGEPFLCFSVERDTPFTDPNTGNSIDTRTKLSCQVLDQETMHPIGLVMEFKTLASTIYERAGGIRPGDFPAVVSIRRVPVKKYGNSALILERLSVWPLPDAPGSSDTDD